MYNSSKYNNNHHSNYYSLAQQFQPKRYHHSISANFNNNQLLPSNYQPQQLIFNNNFNLSQNLNSAHVQKRYQPKYRSSSLPSQCIVRNLSSNHFSYYDQLRRRDYITTNNCYSSYSKNKYQPLFNKQKCLSYSSNNDLNRFYKYGYQDNKIAKNHNGPVVKTNVKIYDKYDKNNRYTQIQSNFQPQHENFNSNYQQNRNQRHDQIPIIDCSIQVKSDDQGRFYSTVQSQFPAVLTNQKTSYNQQQKIFTTQATLVRDYSHSFDNIPLRTQSNHLIIPQHNLYQQKFNQNKQCQTYVIKKKKQQSKRQKVVIQLQDNQQKYLKSINNKRQKPKKPQLKTVKSPLKQKIIFQYLSDSKKLISPTSNRKNNPLVKKLTQNESQKYIYSKYFIAQMQSKSKQKKRSKSIRKNENSDRKEKTKGSLSKRDENKKTQKKVADAQSPKAKKNNQKQKRLCQQNYASTHLLTAKK